MSRRRLLTLLGLALIVLGGCAFALAVWKTGPRAVEIVETYGETGELSPEPGAPVVYVIAGGIGGVAMLVGGAMVGWVLVQRMAGEGPGPAAEGATE